MADDREEEYEPLFDAIEREVGSGQVHPKDVVSHIKSLEGSVPVKNKKLNKYLSQLEGDDKTVLSFKEFMDLMDNIKGYGWSRYKTEKGTGATEKDIEEAFSKIDKDKSGSITKQELKLSNRFLAKTFGLKDAKAWEKLMKETDNGDGNLTFNEFADLVRRGQSQAFRGKIVK